MGREPRSLVFRRVKRVLEAHHEPGASSNPALPHPLFHQLFREYFDGLASKPSGVVLRQLTEEERTARAHALAKSWPWTHSISLARSVFVSAVPPVAPSIGQLWHQTGVKVPKLERVLRWDGTDWVIAGLVSDSAVIMKQGLQVCGFQEALADAHVERDNQGEN
jgi:hypothetical protein